MYFCTELTYENTALVWSVVSLSQSALNSCLSSIQSDSISLHISHEILVFQQKSLYYT